MLLFQLDALHKHHLFSLISLLLFPLGSMIILMAWPIWKHRNDCIFEGASPNVSQLERALWDEVSLEIQ
jgi:hypothetical protein